MVVIGQKWLYAEKSSYIRQKRLYLGNVACIRAISGCIRAKVVVFEQSGCFLAKVVVFG